MRQAFKSSEAVGQRLNVTRTASWDFGSVFSKVARTHRAGLASTAAIVAATIACGGDAVAPSFANQPSTAVLPFRWPTTQPKANDLSSVLSQGYAEYDDGAVGMYHTGFDIRADPGAVVNSVAEGWVALVQKNDPTHGCDGLPCDHGMGNTIIIGHELADGSQIFTQYSHLLDWAPDDALLRATTESCAQSSGKARWQCTKSQVSIQRGQLLGHVGATGEGVAQYYPKAHLHFETKKQPTLGSAVNDGAGHEYGYSTAEPNSGWTDPMPFFHPNIAFLGSPRPLRPLTSGSSARLRMGPGGEGLGGQFVAYRPIDALGPALAVSAAATLAGPTSDGCSKWYRVERADGQRLTDRLETDLSTGRLGSFRSAWVCADAVTENVAPSFFATSLSGGAAPSDLYQVEAAAGGIDQHVGLIRATNGSVPAITDLALSSDGTLYAVSFTTLYTVNRTNATATDLGGIGATDVNGLAVARDGTLYASTIGGRLLRRDQTAGWLTVGSFGGFLGSTGDIAFSPNGELFATMSSLGGPDRLARIEPSTGLAIVISPSSGMGFTNVWGLTFVGNVLYGVTTGADLFSAGKLVQVDIASGLASEVRQLSFAASGAASKTTPP